MVLTDLHSWGVSDNPPQFRVPVHFYLAVEEFDTASGKRIAVNGMPRTHPVFTVTVSSALLWDRAVASCQHSFSFLLTV